MTLQIPRACPESNECERFDCFKKNVTHNVTWSNSTVDTKVHSLC